MSLEATVRELLDTELWLGIYVNQSENWKNRDYINFGKKEISMEKCTELLSSEESCVFFYQDIFKLC